MEKKSQLEKKAEDYNSKVDSISTKVEKANNLPGFIADVSVKIESLLELTQEVGGEIKAILTACISESKSKT
jgi:hypothetical protein